MTPTDQPEDGDQFDEFAEGDRGGTVPDSEAVAAALPGVVGLGDAAAEYSRMIDIGDRYLGLATTGLGPKLAVARARGVYRPVGIDCVAITVNELLAAGLTPVCYVNHLTVAETDEAVAEAVARGIAEAAEQAGILLLGGELSVDPEGVADLDVVGTAAAVGEPMEVFPGDAATGDRLIGFPKTGLHPDEVAAVRDALEWAELDEAYPGEAFDTVGDALTEPLRLYTYLLEVLRGVEVHAAVALDGGWGALSTMGEYRYVVSDPPERPPIFDLLETETDSSRADLYRTVTMGTGLVLAAPESAAKELVRETDGEVIGVVERGSGVEIRGNDITDES